MSEPRLLRGVGLLEGPDRQLRRETALLEDGRLAALGAAASDRAAALGIEALPADDWCLAPPLVDPHSVLEEPFGGRAETLQSLCRSAAAAGYGTVALLPRARSWRDRPERLQLGSCDAPPLDLRLWGSFSVGGRGEELAPHADQLTAGAIGLAEDGAIPPLALLERGLRLGEAGSRPVLLAPRDPSLDLGGFVREGVETLRAGWPPDPVLSETLPLESLLALARALPRVSLRLASLSTAAGVARLRAAETRPLASVCWWHLVADSGRLDPLEEGWRLVPSLGAPQDRLALVEALEEGLITAVAVQHEPLDAEERLLPLDQRRPGLAGHRLVLPLLWQELVAGRGWSPEALWQALCWGPARLLGLPEPRLEPGCRRWILFDPHRLWHPEDDEPAWVSRAANQPFAGRSIRGRVLASGLCPGLWRGPR